MKAHTGALLVALLACRAAASREPSLPTFEAHVGKLASAQAGEAAPALLEHAREQKRGGPDEDAEGDEVGHDAHLHVVHNVGVHPVVTTPDADVHRGVEGEHTRTADPVQEDDKWAKDDMVKEDEAFKGDDVPKAKEYMKKIQRYLWRKVNKEKGDQANTSTTPPPTPAPSPPSDTQALKAEEGPEAEEGPPAKGSLDDGLGQLEGKDAVALTDMLLLALGDTDQDMVMACNIARKFQAMDWKESGVQEKDVQDTCDAIQAGDIPKSLTLAQKLQSALKAKAAPAKAPAKAAAPKKGPGKAAPAKAPAKAAAPKKGQAKGAPAKAPAKKAAAHKKAKGKGAPAKKAAARKKAKGKGAPAKKAAARKKAAPAPDGGKKSLVQASSFEVAVDAKAAVGDGASGAEASGSEEEAAAAAAAAADTAAVTDPGSSGFEAEAGGADGSADAAKAGGDGESAGAEDGGTDGSARGTSAAEGEGESAGSTEAGSTDGSGDAAEGEGESAGSTEAGSTDGSGDAAEADGTKEADGTVAGASAAEADGTKEADGTVAGASAAEVQAAGDKGVTVLAAGSKEAAQVSNLVARLQLALDEDNEDMVEAMNLGRKFGSMKWSSTLAKKADVDRLYEAITSGDVATARKLAKQVGKDIRSS